MNTKERVRRWVDGELDAAASAALLAEAARAPDLARAIEDARSLAVRLAEASTLAQGTPPEDLVEHAVRRAIRARTEHDARPTPWWEWLVQPVTLRVRVLSLLTSAVIVVVGLAGLRAWRIDRNTQRAMSPSAPVAGPAVAMHERTSSAAGTVDTAAAPAAMPVAPRTVPVRFVLPARGAHAVTVAGDFNQWQAQSDAASLRDDDGDGVFVGTLRLPPGTYAYMFVVDGERWVSDPYATNTRDDGFGHQNAVLRID